MIRNLNQECPHPDVVAFLCSDLASGITGETTFVDAGSNIMGMVFDED